MERIKEIIEQAKCYPNKRLAYCLTEPKLFELLTEVCEAQRTECAEYTFEDEFSQKAIMFTPLISDLLKETE